MLRASLLRARGERVIDAGAVGAWKTLESKLRPFVARRLRCPADVDDVVQEVFLRIHRGTAGLRAEEKLGPWIYRVARNAIIDHFRKAAGSELAARSDATQESLAQSDLDEAEAERSFAECTVSFVAALPSPYREALTLTELEGVSQRQAAAMLGLSSSGMKSRVQRARRQLRAALESCCRIALDANGHVIDYEPRSGKRHPPGCSC